MANTTSAARRIQANRRLVRGGATSDDVDRAKSRLDAVFRAYPASSPSVAGFGGRRTEPS